MKKLILILFLFSPVEAQTFKVLPWEYDSPTTEQGDLFKYDKLDHFVSHMVLTMIIPTKRNNLDLLVSIGAGFLFEVVDGFNNSRTWGFSRTDFIFDIAGSIAGVFLKDLCHELGFYVLINKNGISIHF